MGMLSALGTSASFVHYRLPAFAFVMGDSMIRGHKIRTGIQSLRRLICPAPIGANLRRMPTTQRLLGVYPEGMRGLKCSHPMPALSWKSTLANARCVREKRKLMVDAGGGGRRRQHNFDR